ncbi:MAG: histidine phosphatase family protein [Planctomycetota bacterium]
MARLWLVRHGETEWNAESRIQGHLDPPLNAVGRDQALDAAGRLAAYFRGQPAPPIYTSDLRRAAQTAIAIGRALRTRPRVAKKLRERAFGVLEGKTLPELAETLPDEVRAYRRGQKDAIPEAEPYAAFCERAVRAARAIARREPRAVVVTHGGVIKAVLRVALGPDAQFMVGNTALYTVDVDPLREVGGIVRVLSEEEVISSAQLDPVG